MVDYDCWEGIYSLRMSEGSHGGRVVIRADIVQKIRVRSWDFYNNCKQLLELFLSIFFKLK